MNEHHKFFSELTDLYASARPKYPPELFAFLFKHVPDFNIAWDCATGSGQAAISLAEKFQRVYASDVSSEQISQAFKHERITYSTQESEHTNYSDNSFSLITVATALHWFDFNQYWNEVDRVLKPQGIFAAWTYTWFTVDDDIDSIIKTSLLDIIEPYWTPQHKICWNGYKDLEIPFTELQVPEMTLINNWNLNELLAYLHTWSATRKYMKDHGDQFFIDLKKFLLPLWGKEVNVKKVSMSLLIRVFRK